MLVSKAQTCFEHIWLNNFRASYYFAQAKRQHAYEIVTATDVPGIMRSAAQQFNLIMKNTIGNLLLPLSTKRGPALHMPDQFQDIDTQLLLVYKLFEAQLFKFQCHILS